MTDGWRRRAKGPEMEWWVEAHSLEEGWQMESIHVTRAEAFVQAQKDASRFKCKTRIVEIARYILQELQP